MAFEIERKYLLTSDRWRNHIDRTISIQQAYLCNTDKASLRVRIADDAAFISSKSMTLDIRRHEFEYNIPLHDAEFMITHMCSGCALSKNRHLVRVGRHTWEIDEFLADNAGLVVAEIELQHEQEPFQMPDWAGREVSGDIRYFNMSLVQRPYKTWTT